MNLFRSEEHAKRWRGYNPAFEQFLQPLASWAERFAGELFRNRTRPDYITWFTAWRAAQQQR